MSNERGQGLSYRLGRRDGRGASLWRAALVSLAAASALAISGCAKHDTPDPAPESVGTSAAALSGDSGTDAAPPSPAIGSFAVYATEALEMNASALVSGGNVGVENTTGPFLGGNAAAYFNSGATIQSSQTLYAYSVYFSSGDSFGPVDTDKISGNGGATYGTVSTFPTMPSAPSAPSATAGTTSITLNSNQSQTIAAGSYAGITVNSGATLTLSGGTYVFSSLTLNSGGTLAVSAPTTLSVTGGASFGGSSFVGPASGSGLTAKALALYLDTSNGVNLNSGAKLQALVVATKAKVTVNTSQFTGALAAAQVLMNSGATVTFQDGFGSPGGAGDAGGTNLCAGVTCTASDACHVAGVCSPSTGVCSNPTAANGTSCNDGNACTQTDQCESGVCTGSNPVVCSASDPCHRTGTCAPSTGECSNPVASNGTTCNDGNLCDLNDTCQAGVCTAGGTVVCSASDACHVAGTCSPSTGACSNPVASNGTTCNDGNLCDLNDTCQAGVCTAGGTVVCTTSDQCHVAGTCSPSTGACSNPVASNGTTCSDGNACTQSDTCQSGACVGSNPVTCTASDPCHTAGTCSPSTGQCSNPIASNGTSCSDGNACTQTDTCQNGTCTGSNPVVCSASDQCHSAGSCNPSTGSCSNPVALNGAPCSDGNLCDLNDTCQSGTCTAGGSVTCTASDPCHTAGTCSPSTGQCSNPVASNGTSCSDGNACTTGDTCQSGACTGGPPVQCVASDSCHVAGTCTSGDGGTGGCSNPVAASGTACSEGACGGSCSASGSCVAAVVATNACYSATCAPDGGVTNGPSSCVPTLNGTVATNIASMVGGPNINPAQVSLVRGRVLGLPEATLLGGVTVSILGHPEYGTSISAPDGTYALAVNGGAQIVVNFAGPSGETTYLPVQRHTPSQWQQYAVIPDVYLTPTDPNGTVIQLDSPTWQAAKGSTITDPADENGVDGGPPVKATAPHTARLFVPSGTTASFAFGSCGNTEGACGGTCSEGTCTSGTCIGSAPAALTVRMTEYTVGATGLQAMPAELPPATGYTYAVELSTDEEVATGASGVEFNQAVSFYVDDFIGFGEAQPGTANPPVPVGFYDRSSGTWVPSANGAVMKITGFTGTCPGAGCEATVAEPTGDAGTSVSLSADELAFLGQTYGGEATPVYVWRVSTTHFSGLDTNWSRTLPDGGIGPTGPGPGPGNPDPHPGCGGGGDNNNEDPNGSIVDCRSQILAEQVSIPGTAYFLRYQSERAPGRLPTIRIPLTGASWPPPALPLSVQVTIQIAGNTYNLSYPAASLSPNQVATWVWDQKDAFGNTVEGYQSAIISVANVYAAQYVPPSPTPVDFDSWVTPYLPFTVSANRALNQISLAVTSTVQIGVEDPAPMGLGGWTLSAQHVYDPNSKAFWGGDGTRRLPRAPIIQSLPGGTQASDLEIAVAPNGTLYETNDGILYSVSTSGALTQMTKGTGATGAFPPCTPLATASPFYEITGLAVAPSGLIYLSRSAFIDVVDPVAGTIQTVAGTGSGTGAVIGCQDALVATQGTLGEDIGGIALAPDGSLYIADESCLALRRLGTDGSLRTITATSTSICDVGSFANDGIPTWPAGHLASQACIQPTAVAVGGDGSVYVSDGTGNFPRVNRIDGRTGIITTFAGTESSGTAVSAPSLNDGKAATMVRFAGQPQSLAVDSGGYVYITDGASGVGTGALYGVDPQGTIHLIAGGAPLGTTTEVDNAPAVGGLVNTIGSLAVDPNGSILMRDTGSSGNAWHVRAVLASFPSYAPGTVDVPSPDGSEVYIFSPFGQHTSTIDPVTGATLRTFTYDSQSRLTSIVETRGGTTRLAYSGSTVTITPPFSNGGQQMVLTLDMAGGHAISMSTPAGETTELTYSDGLLTSLLDPKSNLHTFQYDPNGFLLRDTDPTNATISAQHTTVDVAPSPDGGVVPIASWSAERTSGAGHVMSQDYFTLTNGTVERNIFAPSGATYLLSESSGELWTSVAADGTTTSTQQAPDPQFGMLDAYPGSVTRKTPSGLTYRSVRTRTSTGSALTPSTITDLTTLNGQSEPWSRLYTAKNGSTAAHWLMTSPAGRETFQQLDSLGRITTISYPGTKSLPTTSFVYDADGRVSSVTLTPNANGGGAPRVTTNGYDTYLPGYLATTEDPVGDVTTYDERDLDGRVLDVELPDFAVVSQSHVSTTYDDNGNITSITVPPATSLSSTHTFTSNPVDLPASYTPPQVSSSSSGDDPELATLTTSYAYTADRQVTTTDVPEGTGYSAVMVDYDTYGRTSATYDPLSNVTANISYLLNASNVATDQVASIVTSDGVSLTNSFDGFLKTKTTWNSPLVAGSVAWTYDDFFRPSTLQVGSSTPITFAYDLDSLYVGTSSPAFTVVRDVSGSSLDGLPYSSTLGTVSDVWTYDGFGAPSSYTVRTSDGTVLYAWSGEGGDGTPVTRDANGRITAMLETTNGVTHSWAYTYDTRGRLSGATEDGAVTAYGYDPNGNLVTVNSERFGTYDAQDRLVTLSPPGGNTWTLAYTNNGDLTSKVTSGQTFDFAYDLSSNLRSVDISGVGGASIDYVIDGLNRRIGKSITGTATVQDGLLYNEQKRVVAELDGSNNVLSTFIYGLKTNVPDYMVRGGLAYRIVSDWRGDVRLVLDTTKTGAAAVVEQIDYDAWGNVVNIVDPSCSIGGTALCFQPFGFAGGVWEPSTGFVRFGARDYDPQAARWAQKDPSGFRGGRNLYAYAFDNSVDRVDSDGDEPNAVSELCATRGAYCPAYHNAPFGGSIGGLVSCRRTYSGGLPGGSIKFTCTYEYPDGDQCTFFNGGFIGICNSFFPSSACEAPSLPELGPESDSAEGGP